MLSWVQWITAMTLKTKLTSNVQTMRKDLPIIGLVAPRTELLSESTFCQFSERDD